MVEFLGIQNFQIYGIIGAVVIGLIVWYIIRNFRGGRISLEQHEIAEDRQLKRTDEEIRDAAEDERRQADKLWNLINLLSSRLSQIGFNESGERSNQYFFILQGLQVIRGEGKSVFQDKKTIAEINNAINMYLDGLPNDPPTNELVGKIRDTQNKLFADIIKQYQELRQKMGLLREEFQETGQEAGFMTK